MSNRKQRKELREGLKTGEWEEVKPTISFKESHDKQDAPARWTEYAIWYLTGKGIINSWRLANDQFPRKRARAFLNYLLNPLDFLVTRRM